MTLSDLKERFANAGFREFKDANHDSDVSMQLTVREGNAVLYHVFARLHDFTQFGAEAGSVSSSITAYFETGEDVRMRAKTGGHTDPDWALEHFREIYENMRYVPYDD